MFELVLAIVVVVLTLLAVASIGFALVFFFGRDQERADDEAAARGLRALPQQAPPRPGSGVMDVQPLQDSVDRRPAGLPVFDSPDGMSQGARMRALLAAHQATRARRARWVSRWERVRARWDALWTWEPVSWPR